MLAGEDTIPASEEATGRPEPVMMYDEPEAAVLLVACGIGLLTGQDAERLTAHAHTC